MEGVLLLPISDLLHRRRPFSATFSLHHQPPPSPPPPLSPLSPISKTLNPNTLPKILNSLSQPSILTGILSLPTSTLCHSHLSCFSFSDDTGSLCCDLIRFDFSMIGRTINVLAWNFIPFKHSGGFLEIILWEFHQSVVLPHNVDVFPLTSQPNHSHNNNNNNNNNNNKAKYSVCGLLNSVSPVSCSKDQSSGSFIAEISCCDTEVSEINGCVKDSSNVVLGCDANSRTKYVYFSGDHLCWYPVLLRLTGTMVSISGLKKKLIYIAKEEGHIMFVSNEMTCFHNPELHQRNRWLFQSSKDGFKGNGEVDSYIGVVSGIHMQGMIVELDKDVWLLMTDGTIFLSHSVRVGAIISVRNVHVINPKFAWGQILLLGSCCKSNVNTISFSPLETGCPLMLRSQSLLGKFIESLVFPARLWVLQMVQCLRKKFAGTFSEKEILGTKHKEGLLQTYARSILPSSVAQSRYGIFMEFCKHDSSCSGSNSYHDNLNLVLPFSILVYYCESICVKSLLKMNDGLRILEACSQVGHPYQDNKLDHLIRRILPSKDIGVPLLGNVKICSATGRLQYIDATCSIGAIVPDIPITWDMNAIYEVVDYSLVLEGSPEMWVQLLDRDLFSCCNLFENIPVGKRVELTVYVHFSWSNVCCRHLRNHSCQSSINSFRKLHPGTFHMVAITHKFPLQPKFHSGQLLSGKSHFFAEVMVLPWDLNIDSNDSVTHSKLSQADLSNACRDGSAFKRCKTLPTSSCFDKVGLCNNFGEYGKRSCNEPCNIISLPHKTRSVNKFSSVSLAQIPCTITVRKLHGQSMALPAVLSSTDGNHGIPCSGSPRKVILEFNSENLFKFKLLQIGCCYIMEHCVDKCFCESHHQNLQSSISITSETKFWSLSFNFSENDWASGPCNDLVSALNPNSEKFNRFYLQDELILNPCNSSNYGTFSDVHLHVAADATGLLDVLMTLQTLKSLKPIDIYSIGHGNSLRGFFDNQGLPIRNGLPEGNLISLMGTLVGFYNPDSHFIERNPCDRAAVNVHLSIIKRETEGSTFLLALTDDHLVQICGRLSNVDYPLGLGPGAVVTFHRILAFSGQSYLMLTPASLITINSVREVHSLTMKPQCPMFGETIATCLLSDLIHADVCQLRSFRCSIVAVYFVMLDRNKNMDKLSSTFNFNRPIINIPVAGFILDDGSSHCCCWTNGKRAATFLRLHEEIPQVGSRRSWWDLKAAVRSGALSAPSYHLYKILKKHGRVKVKNYGSIHDASCQDLHLSFGSDYTFSNQDEDLVKFIMLNACSSTFWNVIGYVMDFDAVSKLENNLLEEQMTMHGMQNVWAREVCQVNPLAQARALLQNL